MTIDQLAWIVQDSAVLGGLCTSQKSYTVSILIFENALDLSWIVLFS